jgi:hypothetical protein
MPQLPFVAKDTVEDLQEKVKQAMVTELEKPPKNMPPPGEKPLFAIGFILLLAAFLYFVFV